LRNIAKKATGEFLVVLGLAALLLGQLKLLPQADRPSDVQYLDLGLVKP
jgi:hypothetical protein